MRTDDLARRDLDSRRRQGQSGRPDACRSPRARATRGVKIVEDVEVTGVPPRERPAPASRPRVRTTARARDRLRGRRQLRRPVGAPVRRAGRRQRAAVFGRALLHRHRPHRRRASDAAGDARPRRLHLLQGGGRRPGDGRLRAARPSRGRVDPIPATFQFELLDEDWDQFEPLMTTAIHRTPCLETRAGQDAAQRPRELHARRQLHPRRGARAAQLLRRRRLQLGRHRQLRRRRAG